VIWAAHVKEMTDLPEDARAHFMQVVFAVEAVLREVLRPHKLNLASLGNITPHLHWHVIPRFADDPHFPNPIWGARIRAPVATGGVQLVDALRASLAQRLR
jgi:diadenosine tetraphosphate (Ap4A) HIT family hydrolase